MKKSLAALLTIGTMLALAACQPGTDPEASSDTETDAERVALLERDEAATPAERPSLTPAENPLDPWASYVNDGWDSEADYINATESGLEYIALAGPEACASNVTGSDIALAHYEGRLLDGSVFDSSFARNQPAQFPANRVIRGWTEALGMMCPGDDWLVYVPSNLAYGQYPPPGSSISAGDDLIFRIVLLAELDLTPYPSDVWTGTAFAQ